MNNESFYEKKKEGDARIPVFLMILYAHSNVDGRMPLHLLIVLQPQLGRADTSGVRLENGRYLPLSLFLCSPLSTEHVGPVALA